MKITDYHLLDEGQCERALEIMGGLESKRRGRTFVLHWSRECPMWEGVPYVCGRTISLHPIDARALVTLAVEQAVREANIWWTARTLESSEPPYQVKTLMDGCIVALASDGQWCSWGRDVPALFQSFPDALMAALRAKEKTDAS